MAYKLNANKIRILALVLISTLSAGYYFGIYLPNKKAGMVEQQKQEQAQLTQKQQENKQVDPEIDIENTVVLCKNEEQFIGKKLISDGLNFQVIGGMIFYKGEELERLCNPDLKEFDDAAEPSFYIFPAYKGEVDYSKYEGDTTAEELRYSQDGYGVGYFDGKDINLKLKASYNEPDAQDHFKNVYLYGYLSGYIKGCNKSNPASEDCKYAKATLDGMENLVGRKPENQGALADERTCENEQEIETFKKPVQVVWLAEFGGCLVGCEGASFDRLPIGGDFKYPFFAGYFGEGVFKEELLKEGLTLKIYGKWIGIDADHPKLVFDNKCVPIVDIEKIEVVK